MAEHYQISRIPFPLCSSEPWNWRIEGGAISVGAKPRSDIFVDPSTGDPRNASRTLNAVTLTGVPPEGDFTLESKVTVGFRSQFDAGVLLLWFSEDTWAKLCFERSPAGKPTVVTVVCRGIADDCNSFVVDGSSVWLRIGRQGGAFTFHASVDGQRWNLVRFFALGGADVALRLGFECQSPMGEGCDVDFSGIAFSGRTISDIRDGS